VRTVIEEGWEPVAIEDGDTVIDGWAPPVEDES
jgi:hypothetical protein